VLAESLEIFFKSAFKLDKEVEDLWRAELTPEAKHQMVSDNWGLQRTPAVHWRLSWYNWGRESKELECKHHHPGPECCAERQLCNQRVYGLAEGVTAQNASATLAKPQVVPWWGPLNSTGHRITSGALMRTFELWELQLPENNVQHRNWKLKTRAPSMDSEYTMAETESTVELARLWSVHEIKDDRGLVQCSSDRLSKTNSVKGKQS
jgi:hypothetical protein